MQGLKIFNDNKYDSLQVGILSSRESTATRSVSDFHITGSHTITGSGNSSMLNNVSSITADNNSGLIINGKPIGPDSTAGIINMNAGVRATFGDLSCVEVVGQVTIKGENGVIIEAPTGFIQMISADNQPIFMSSGDNIEINTSGMSKHIFIGIENRSGGRTPVSINYEPSTPSDWGTIVPTTIEEALNLLAAKNAPVTP